MRKEIKQEIQRQMKEILDLDFPLESIAMNSKMLEEFKRAKALENRDHEYTLHGMIVIIDEAMEDNKVKCLTRKCFRKQLEEIKNGKK